jgi:hypothetical protein
MVKVFDGRMSMQFKIAVSAGKRRGHCLFQLIIRIAVVLKYESPLG